MNDSLCNLTKMVGLDLELPEPDLLLSEGDEVNVGRETLKVLHTPGHTPGGISLLAESEKPPVVFCGDLVFKGSVGRTDLPGGDREALRAAIEDKILTLPDDTVVLPGHEHRTTVGDERDTVTYL
jgi:glyoxylase-like metal-dependent hydrolase (beta-lactamase superfamily II)